MAEIRDIHKVENVYAKVDGGNDEITFDAVVEGEKIPVTTVNHNRMETHFVYDKAPETDANAATTTATTQTGSGN